MFSKVFGQKRQSAHERPSNSSPNTEAAKAEARGNPGGWVYEIAGGYNSTEAVPPQAIKGAWKVDDAGNITDTYQANPNFDPNFRKPN